MGINLDGLCGRNILFWRFGIPKRGYIIKYTDEGNFYVLTKSNGKLYHFYQHTIYGEHEKDAFETISCEKAQYSEVQKYGLNINSNNWREFIDFNHSNPFFSLKDAIDCFSDTIRILSLIALFLWLCLRGSGFETLFYVGAPLFILSLLIDRRYKKRDVYARRLLARYNPKDEIDYRTNK